MLIYLVCNYELNPYSGFLSIYKTDDSGGSSGSWLSLRVLIIPANADDNGLRTMDHDLSSNLNTFSTG